MDTNTLQYYVSWLEEYFISHNVSPTLAIYLNVLINVIFFTGFVVLLDILSRKIIVGAFKLFSTKTRSTFDDFLVASNFPRFIAHFIPLTIFNFLLPEIFIKFPFISKQLVAFNGILFVILSIYVFRSVLRSINNYPKSKEKYKDKPMESYVQVLMIFAWGIGLFIIINKLAGYSAISVATLSAASAVILLIFKDTILGFVASIQISVNDIVRLGDWITVQKYGADGYVTEINLATVLVQNFDNTFTTIPTYSLVSESFQNWRGMQNADGRRIKRALFIKQNSVHFLTQKDIEAYKKISLVTNYLTHREKDIAKHNLDSSVDKSLLINGRNQTNLGVFRKYIDAYLRTNSAINKKMTLMVRHLPPTTTGIPLEVYCFSFDKEWVNYEHIQADIFDHIISASHYFNLELFEEPSGKDFEGFTREDSNDL